MTDEQIARAKELQTRGLSYQKIANELGISPTTAYRWLNPEFRNRDAQRRKEWKQTHKKEMQRCKAKWYQSHKEEVRQYNARYRQTHQEYYTAYQKQYHRAYKGTSKYYKQWYQANKEKAKEYQRKYRQDHKEELRERYRKTYWPKYYSTHKEQRRESQKRYRQTHRAERNSNNAKRRALKRSEQPRLTDQQKAEIREIYRRAREDRNVYCYICGKKIPLGHRHVDHIIPLSRGGKHVPSNLAIACDRCNLRKNAKTPEEIGMLI